jgi:hypothetical protein
MNEREIIERQIADHQDAIDAAKDRLQAVIDAEKKPRLRHGDYGIGSNWGKDSFEPFFYAEQSTMQKAFYSSGAGQVNCDHSKHKVIGNIFDDIAARSEELEVTYSIGDRFKKGSSKYILCSDGNSKIHFVNLKQGTGAGEPMLVEDIELVTIDELRRIWNTHLTRYWDNRKQEKC